MRKENSTQGSGLAILSLLMLAVAFLITFYMHNSILGSIIAVISAILAFAAFFEARRAGGPRQMALTILIIAILGAIFSLVWTISAAQKTETETLIISPPEVTPDKPDEMNTKERLKELEKKAEKLEEDTVNGER